MIAPSSNGKRPSRQTAKGRQKTTGLAGRCIAYGIVFALCAACALMALRWHHRSDDPLPKEESRRSLGKPRKAPIQTHSAKETQTVSIDNQAIASQQPDAAQSAEEDEAAKAEAERIQKWKDKFAKRRTIFTNGSDQILSMIASAPPGQDMPPLPITKSIDRDFATSLETPIEILDGDSEEVKAAKEAVLKLRAEVLAIKESEGLSVYEILTQHQDLVRENASYRVTVQKEVLELYRSGDEDLAREYAEKANETLERLGAEPVKMPGAENPELRQHIRDRLDSIKNKKDSSRR